MLYYLFFLMAIIGIFFHRSKVVHWILMIYIFIIVSLNSYNPDYHSYFLIFDRPESAQEEIGFRWLCMIGEKIGLTYDQFHGIICLIALTLLFLGIRKLLKYDTGNNNNFALASYIIFPMMFDVTLFRSFISGCIIIFSLSFLYDKKCWKFVCVVLLASSIHVSSIMFLSLLLARKLNENHLKKRNTLISQDENYSIRKKRYRIVGIIFSAILAMIILLKTNVLQAFLINVGVNTVKVNLMLNGQNITMRKIILTIGIHLVNFFVYKFIHRKFVFGASIERHLEMDRIVYVMNYILLLNAVFTIYSDQFLRILGVGIIINSIYYSALLNIEYSQRRRWIYMYTGIVPAFMLFLFRMFAYYTPQGEVYYSYIFKCVIDNNFILQ